MGWQGTHRGSLDKVFEMAWEYYPLVAVGV